MLSPATVGSAQDAERLLDVTVQFAHFFVSGGCGIGPLAEAERYKVPASRTCQQLKEQMMAETKHLWDDYLARLRSALIILGKSFQDFYKACGEPCVYFELNCLRNQKLDAQMTLGDVYAKWPPEKAHKPFLFDFGVYDAAAARQERAKEAAYVQYCKERLPQVQALIKKASAELTEDQIREILLFPFSSVCPYDYVKVPEGSVPDRDNYIKKHRKEWEHASRAELDEKLSKWATHSPAHLAQLVKVLTTKESVDRMSEVPHEGKAHQGPALRQFLHYVRPGKTQNASSGRQWKELFGEVVPHEAQLAFLCAVRLSKAFHPMPSTWMIPFEWIKYLIEKLGGDKALSLPVLAAMPREFTDPLKEKPTMPDILPREADLVKMSEADIEKQVAAYVGVDTEMLHTILYPGGSSNAGFLKQGDRLGAVIKKDAEFLLAAGVTRTAIADFLETAMQHADRSGAGFGPRSQAPAPEPADTSKEKLTVSSISWMGFQSDPFNPTFGNRSALGTSSDYKILPDRVGFPGLITTLIRRLCFFESGGYRVEPAKLLSLLKREFAPAAGRSDAKRTDSNDFD